MRVAFVSQLPFCVAFGGLEIQVLRTAEALRALGVDVDFLDPWAVRFDADLLHCFGSEYQLFETVARAKGREIPVVVSSIFAPRRPLAFLRAWKHLDGLVPMTTSFGARRGILQRADAVVALSEHEAANLTDLFNVERQKIGVIPNGVDDRFRTADPGEFEAAYGLKDIVLCVASVERNKNQHRLLDAVAGTGLPTALIGAVRASEGAYVRGVDARLRDGSAALWIRGLPHDSSLLASAYAAARVLALPSLAEAQPLAVVEAAAAGANVVVSDFPALREVFGSYVWYCDPRSVHSIRGAILDAYRAPRGARYTAPPAWVRPWRAAAEQLRRVYEAVLTRPAGTIHK
jgi:glycosyltransferase involved in cell wall biosynthesis